MTRTGKTIGNAAAAARARRQLPPADTPYVHRLIVTAGRETPYLGYQVRLPGRRGERGESKTFGVKAYGSADTARRAAVRWRNKALRAMGIDP